jgi:hypothetical protein
LVLSAEVVKLADTPSAHRLILSLPKPKKTISFFFDFNKLYLRVRYRQQPPVGTRCRQSVQYPVQSARGYPVQEALNLINQKSILVVGASLKEKGLIPSPVASNPALWKRWRIQPSGDGLRADDDRLRDL